MNVVGGGGSQYEPIQSHQQYENRGYFQVTALQPNHHYARQDHMALQLVYVFFINYFLPNKYIYFQLYLYSFWQKSTCNQVKLNQVGDLMK